MSGFLNVIFCYTENHGEDTEGHRGSFTVYNEWFRN